MKLRNILMIAATAGVMFASADRTGVVGYTAGDYSDMNTFPQNATNVAHTSGDNFNFVWADGGNTWGFSGAFSYDDAGEQVAGNELVNMLWTNGNYGVTFGLNMDSGTAASTEPVVAEVAGETTMNMGFGMGLGDDWDMGFTYSTAGDSPMSLNARGNLGFWAFDVMEVGYASDDINTTIDVNMYGLKDWGATTGMFAMGFVNSDAYAWGGTEAASYLTTGFSVESQLAGWCELRMGYNKMFNVGAEVGADESNETFSAGIGFNYDSVQLDMTLSDGTLGNMMSNPLHYVNGRNATGLTSSWTLSYTW